MNKRTAISIIGVSLMLAGLWNFILSQSATNTPDDITHYFIWTALTFFPGFILSSWWGMTDEDFDALFNRFANWLEQPGEYPRLPWGRLVVAILAAFIPTLWAIGWPASTGKVLASVLAVSIFVSISWSFFRAYWHRLELMDKKACAKFIQEQADERERLGRFLLP